MTVDEDEAPRVEQSRCAVVAFDAKPIVSARVRPDLLHLIDAAISESIAAPAVGGPLGVPNGKVLSLHKLPPWR